MVDGQQRFDAEKQLQAQEAAAAEATGAEPQSLRAEAARSKGGSPFDAVDDLRARFNGLDPNSPFVTQRAGSLSAPGLVGVGLVVQHQAQAELEDPVEGRRAGEVDQASVWWSTRNRHLRATMCEPPCATTRSQEERAAEHDDHDGAPVEERVQQHAVIREDGRDAAAEARSVAGAAIHGRSGPRPREAATRASDKPCCYKRPR